MFLAASVISLCLQWTPLGVLLFTSSTAALVNCIRPVALLLLFLSLGSKPLSFQMRQISSSVEREELLFALTSVWTSLKDSLAMMGAPRGESAWSSRSRGDERLHYSRGGRRVNGLPPTAAVRKLPAFPLAQAEGDWPGASRRPPRTGGVVHRARDLDLDREVAVKLLRPGTPADSPAAARFVHQARITGQLQHPGIPAVHELGTLPDGLPFLAM